MRLICPYCFSEFEDTEVLFRSEIIVERNQLRQLLPREYSSYEDFEMIYNGDDKEDIIRKYREQESLAEKSDPEYDKFWNVYSGTTERETVVGLPNFKPGTRALINPAQKEYYNLLVQQSDGNYYRSETKNNRTMVTSIFHRQGNKQSKRRVCPRCHNPLPIDYGFYDIKFISIIGITGSGKTVYLSQLLKNIQTELSGIGMAMAGNQRPLDDFVNDNMIEVGKPLPNATPIQSLQQPIIATIKKTTDQSGCTLVLYDVAGELFMPEHVAELPKYAPFVAHSDGIILLIDAFQCKAIAAAGTEAGKAAPDMAINKISGMLAKKDIPVAVCMSKCDAIAPEILANIADTLTGGVCLGAPDHNNKGSYLPKLNADDFNDYERKLKSFFQLQAGNITTLMNAEYKDFAYFAVTALGCDVDANIPRGPIVPKRIADPLVWLFYKLNIISASGKIFNPHNVVIKCPYCHDVDTRKLESPHVEVIQLDGFMNKLWHRTEERKFNYQCMNCKQYFNYDNEDV